MRLSFEAVDLQLVLLLAIWVLDGTVSINMATGYEGASSIA